jgi:hypothetical protein
MPSAPRKSGFFKKLADKILGKAPADVKRTPKEIAIDQRIQQDEAKFIR